MNDRDLHHLHPALEPLCRQWLDKCHTQSINSFITCTYRSNDEQAGLYALGRSRPGKIITNARPGQSKHNFIINGIPASKAFDFAIMRPDGSLNWNPETSEWK